MVEISELSQSLTGRLRLNFHPLQASSQLSHCHFAVNHIEIRPVKTILPAQQHRDRRRPHIVFTTYSHPGITFGLYHCIRLSQDLAFKYRERYPLRDRTEAARRSLYFTKAAILTTGLSLTCAQERTRLEHLAPSARSRIRYSKVPCLRLGARRDRFTSSQ